MATQKPVRRKNFGTEFEREKYFAKRTKKINRLQELFDKGEFISVIKRTKPLLELGIADAYILALKACEKLKAVRIAERIVQFGLRQGRIKPELLSKLLGNVYLSINDVENYHKLILQVRDIERKKKEALEKLTF
jgi:hypothetical protein